MYSSKLILKRRKSIQDTESAACSLQPEDNVSDLVVDLKDDDLQALEYIYLLICHLCHSQVKFLSQFCDALAVLNVYGVISSLLSLCK